MSKAPALFPRVTFEKEETAGEGPNVVSIEEFQRLDLRVGTIRDAEEIPGSSKLLKLTIDIGEPRTIVAGLGAHYTIDGLKNRQVIVLANLRPVKLMGIESQGMILAAEDGQGIYLVRPDTQSTPGSPIS
jgi:methionyl-tRNA synthetase